MRIREAKESDIPQIIEVLKSSLGEISSKKTEEVWKYKHLDNPFGKSLVLIAIENKTIIGVRALMRWDWQLGQQAFSVFRAVDTATHPEHQGKGVFKKLTLDSIKIAREHGFDFIFNTPNTQSLPGYLKMDWKKVGNLKIRLKPVNPIHWLNNFKGKTLYNININCSPEQLIRLISRYNEIKSENNKIFTCKSPEYLCWRYQSNALQEYEVIADEDFYLAGYIKKHKYFKELRITEHIFCDQNGLRKLNNAIRVLSAKFGAQIISSSDLFSRIEFSGDFGPILTLRNVNLDLNINQELLQLNNWSYNLGDLELF